MTRLHLSRLSEGERVVNKVVKSIIQLCVSNSGVKTLF